MGHKMAMMTWTLSLKNLETVDANDNILKQALISLKRGKHRCQGKLKESVIKVVRKGSPEEVSCPWVESVGGCGRYIPMKADTLRCS